MPKLTIITINYNNASGLQKTMESVFSQTNKNFEYIVIDGASTDKSKEIIQYFDKRNTTHLNDSTVTQLHNYTITHFNAISEPDNGIYHAMNKGIQMAKGDYIQFLNSGDCLVDERVVEDVLNELPDCDIFVGNVVSFRPDGSKRYNKNKKEVSLLTFYRGTIQHTSAFIRRSLFDKYGLYDENLKIVSDWKWYMQVAGLNKADVRFTDRYISLFDMTGISSTQLDKDKAERRKVLEELIPAPILADYDKHAFAIDQFERLRRYPFVYKMVWFMERVLFKMEKRKIKRGWKKN